MDSWFQKFTYNNAEEEEIGWNVARIADTRHKYKKSLYYFSLSTKPWRRIGEWRYSSTHTITSALDGSEWPASRLGRLTPRKRAPSTRRIGGWVGPRAGLEAVVKRKIPSPCRDSNP